MTRYLILFLIPFSSLLATNVERIQAHLQIKDPLSACEEAQRQISIFPKEKALWEAYIIALAKAGKEKEMIQAWTHFERDFADPYASKNVLETVAWTIIEAGSLSSSLPVRAMSLLGAFFGQDARGVDILYKHLHDPNSLLRGIAIQLSAELHDARLADRIVYLMENERVGDVRLLAIKAVGKMRVSQAKPSLFKIVGDTNSRAEEKAAAIQSIVLLLETVNRADMLAMVQSKRAGFRLLACQIAIFCDLIRDVDLIISLLHDPCSEVRAAALYTLGFLEIKNFQGQSISQLAEQCLNDPDPHVAITAAWLLACQNVEKGGYLLKQWLREKKQETRLMAAGALKATGKQGLSFIESAFYESEDPFVRLNLAIALISQRVAVKEACRVLDHYLKQEIGRWTWQEKGNFKFLSPNILKFEEDLFEQPETQDQLVRLEILNLLAMLNYTNAREAIIDFLEKKNWGISGTASALLLTEGDDSCIKIVKQLLTHSTTKVKIQAALILALWGKDEDSILVLQQAYDGADREIKEKILEGIGSVGGLENLPFLMSKIKESSPTLRIMAATALIQALNR